MTNQQILDNIAHKNLRIITERSAWYGDDIAGTLVFPLEFRRLQAEYAIAFQKNADTGYFEPLALFGLDEGQNLYLDSSGWDASYIPLSMQRQPFFIGFATATEDGVPVEKPVVHVDMDSPRVSETDGVAVFLEHGGQSPYLEQINSVLLAIHEGYDQCKRLSDVLAALELLEPFEMEYELKDGTRKKLGGLYTLHEETLNALNAASLEQLHRDGFLEAVYMVMASTANFRTLIERKNQRL